MYEELEIDERVRENDVFNAFCGIDEDGEFNAIADVRLCYISEDGEDERILDEYIFDTPVVNVFRTAGMTLVDLIFSGSGDHDLIQLVSSMSEFIKPGHVIDSDRYIKCISVTVTPKNEFSDYFSTGMFATWVLMSGMPGGEADTVRFIFDNEFFGTFMIDFSGDEADMYEEV